ncbi:MAG: 50S ribosome-binding GTPase, partial [Anaerolineales bacterium]|nr:50S ribosome-binding GTPase [Anaerolineales bacterium]
DIMPTNLPPSYYKAEERFRSASNPTDKVSHLEEMLSLIPKHKGTDHLRADLRKKLSKLKDAARSKKGVKRHVSAYHIDKEGAGQIAVIGPPNAGKSTLINAVSNATPEVSPAPFTTWGPTPGMMSIENIQVQLIDTPPLSDEYIDPELLNLIRRVDLILIMVDLQADPVGQLNYVLDTLQENRIAPLHLKGDLDEEGYILYIPCLILVNKYDGKEYEEHYQIFRELKVQSCTTMPVSTKTGYNLETFKQAVFDRLGVIRVYSQPPGKEPDLNAPFVISKGATVAEFAAKVHKDFEKNLKSARIWGKSADFDGQMVSRDHILADEDVVELQT